MLSSPWEGVPTDLPLGAYALGALLGDGYFGQSIGLCSADLELAEWVADDVLARWPELGVRCEPRAGTQASSYYFPAPVNRHGNPLNACIRGLGLAGKHSWEKFIPDIYLNASWQDRLALLQGLMDTDGTAETKGTSGYYATTSPQLAEGAAHLARSLGGTAKTTWKRGRHFLECGTRVDCRMIANVSIKLPPALPLFRLPRKLETTAKRKQPHPNRTLAKVRPCGARPVCAIKVEASGGLVVVSDFVLVAGCAN